MKNLLNIKIALTVLTLCGFSIQGHADDIESPPLATNDEMGEVAFNFYSEENANSDECINCGCSKNCDCHTSSKKNNKKGCNQTEANNSKKSNASKKRSGQCGCASK